MKVIIIDDDAIVAMSMETILKAGEDIEVLALGKDGEDAIELFEKLHPDVVLMDIQMKKMSGLQAAAIMMKKDPLAKVILLTTFLDDEYIKEAIKVGVKGYILKQDYAGVLPALRAVQSGQSVFGSQVISKLPGLLEERDRDAYQSCGITEKEFEIIKLVAKGLSNKEIADQQYLSDGTIRNYISSVLEKLELRDRTQLAVYYYKH